LDRLRQEQTESTRRSVILASLIFIAGFSTIFILLEPQQLMQADFHAEQDTL
jgi:cytochrome c biogenesis protein CcdA